MGREVKRKGWEEGERQGGKCQRKLGGKEGRISKVGRRGVEEG